MATEPKPARKTGPAVKGPTEAEWGAVRGTEPAAPAKPATETSPSAKPAAPPKPATPLPAAPKPTPAPASGATPAPAAKPAAPPAAPPPEPTGDYAMLRDAHPQDVLKYEVLEDGVGVLHVTPDGLLPVAAEAKALGYNVLSLLSAYDRGEHFGVLYAFVKLASRPEEFGELRLRVTVAKKDASGAAVEPEVPSLVPAYKGADWQEREMYDMYGIRFAGHPDMRRIFLPEGWSGWPMRKDYKEPEQYVAMRDGEDIVVKQPEEGAW